MRKGVRRKLVVFLGGAAVALVALPSDAAPKKEADGYVAELVADASYKAGNAATFTVKLAPKAGYHIDAQFPVRWKADDAPTGVTYVKTVLKREDGTFSESDGAFKVGFTAAKPGTYTLGGTLSLSVCNDKNCVMEKVALDTPVTVR